MYASEAIYAVSQNVYGVPFLQLKVYRDAYRIAIRIVSRGNCTISPLVIPA